MFSSSNTLLSSLSTSDFDLLAAHLGSVTLELRKMLEQPNKRIGTVYFPETGQRPLQFGSLGRVGRKPKVDFLRLGENHRHGLRMYWRDDGIGLCRQESE